jgi:hypothetical protein
MIAALDRAPGGKVCRWLERSPTRLLQYCHHRPPRYRGPHNIKFELDGVISSGFDVRKDPAYASGIQFLKQLLNSDKTPLSGTAVCGISFS